MEYKTVPKGYTKRIVVQLKAATETNTIGAGVTADLEDLDVQERDFVAEEDSFLVGVEIQHFPDREQWEALGFINGTDNQEEARRDGTKGLIPPLNQIHTWGTSPDVVTQESMYQSWFAGEGKGYLVEEDDEIYLVGNAHNLSAGGLHYACLAYLHFLQKA